MTYELKFKRSALKAWKKLGPDTRRQFKRKLRERLNNPHVPSARLSSMPNCYKIKLRSSGYRLAYLVEDESVTVTVLAAGRRDGSVYQKARDQLSVK